MKNLKLTQAKLISKSEQKVINGGAGNIDIWCLKACFSSGYPKPFCREICTI